MHKIYEYSISIHMIYECELSVCVQIAGDDYGKMFITLWLCNYHVNVMRIYRLCQLSVQDLAPMVNLNHTLYLCAQSFVHVFQPVLDVQTGPLCSAVVCRLFGTTPHLEWRWHISNEPWTIHIKYQLNVLVNNPQTKKYQYNPSQAEAKIFRMI